MSVQSDEDFADDSPRCLRCWPTGVSCVRFYAVLFFSVAAVLIAGLYLIISNFVPAVASGSASCAMAALISSTIAFWLQPPSINDAVPMMVGTLEANRGAPKRRLDALYDAATRSDDESSSTDDILRESQRTTNNVRRSNARNPKRRRRVRDLSPTSV